MMTFSRINKDRLLDLCQSQTIEDKLIESGLLIISNIYFSDEEFINFTRTFGEIVLPSKQNQNHQYQEILRILPTSNVGKCWHTDLAFRTEPPRYTFLLCRKASELGGETLFINTHYVYQNMTRLMQEKYLHLNGKYSFCTVFKKKLSQRGLTLLEEQQHLLPDVIHPIIKTHPISQKKAIHIHEEYLIALEYYSQEDSIKIINDLYHFLFQPQHIYIHKWAENDLIAIDNRIMLHKGNATQANQIRELVRIIIQ